MCIMCFICLGCRRPRKTEQTEPQTSRPSTTVETEAIIDNMVLPPKTRRSTWLSSSSTVFGSVSATDWPSPPTACLPATASSPNYINPRPSSDSPLYVESYPCCRSEPSTQFLMDSCGGSTTEGTSKESGDVHHGSYTPHYDVPRSHKKSLTEDDLDEVFLNSTCENSEERKYPHVPAHMDNMDSENGIPKEDTDNVFRGNTLKCPKGTRPDIQDRRQHKAHGTPPLPRGNLNRMSLWNPLALPCDVIPGAGESSDQDGGKTGLKPRPCSVPHYVNFKGCLNS